MLSQLPQSGTIYHYKVLSIVVQLVDQISFAFSH
jgi:hypothetical protein